MPTEPQGMGNSDASHTQVLNRLKVRKVMKSNKISEAGNIPTMCGPFRSAFSLGDPLNRFGYRCGGPNQVTDTNSSVITLGMMDGVSDADCGVSVRGVTPSQVPLQSGNIKFVADQSLYTHFKTLEHISYNFNDTTSGGDENNGSYSFIKAVR